MMQRLKPDELSLPISAMLPGTMALQLKELAEARGVTLSDLIRAAVASYLTIMQFGERKEDGKR